MTDHFVCDACGCEFDSPATDWTRVCADCKRFPNRCDHVAACPSCGESDGLRFVIPAPDYLAYLADESYVTDPRR